MLDEQGSMFQKEIEIEKLKSKFKSHQEQLTFIYCQILDDKSGMTEFDLAILNSKLDNIISEYMAKYYR